jgi:uncharacterized cupin superfamily protein
MSSPDRISNPRVAVEALAVAPRARASFYPEPFASRMAGREKRPLGDAFGLKTFGVNLTRLAPGSQSALRHRHSRQDEFIYVLAGWPLLITDHGEIELKPGMCAGFPAGGASHHLVNRTSEDVLYLEIGDRARDDEVFYPDDDIQVVADAQGRRYVHKDGTPY